MGTVSPQQVSDGTTMDASDINNPINTIANEFNGNIDNSNIKSAASIDASKIAGGTTGMFGAWQSWTPSYGGGGITVGNGTVVAKYAQMGKTVHFRYKLTFGSTTSISTAPTISVPVTAATDENGSVFGLAVSTDNASPDNPAPGNLRFSSTTTVQVFALNTNSVNTLITATNPITFGTGDTLEMSGTYEAA